MLLQAPLMTAQTGDVIMFTFQATKNNKKLMIGYFTEPIDAVIEWGDGKVGNIANLVKAGKKRPINSIITHTYSEAKSYKVRIVGKLGGFWNTTVSNTCMSQVTSVDYIYSKSLVSLSNTFRRCTSLHTIPSGIYVPNITDCTRAFYNIKSISSGFPKLWVTNPQAKHSECFKNAFISLYSKYGGSKNCPHYSSTDKVDPARNYYQQFGTQCKFFSSNTGIMKHYTYLSNTCGPNYCEHYGTSIRVQFPQDDGIVNGIPQHHEVTALESGVCMLSPRISIINSGLNQDFSWESGNNWTGATVKVSTAASNSGKVMREIGCSQANCPENINGRQCFRLGSNCQQNNCPIAYSSASWYTVTKCSKSGKACAGSSCPYAASNQEIVDEAKRAGWA